MFILPTHTARMMITQHKIKLLPWPSQSPGLNLWSKLKRRVHKRGPRNDLEKFCEEDFSVFYDLIRSYGRRLRAVIFDKRRLYKVLNAGVPIIVAHVILLSGVPKLVKSAVNTIYLPLI